MDACPGIDLEVQDLVTCPLELDVPRVTAVHDLSFFSLPEDFSALDGARRRSLVGASIRASHAVLACSDFTRREIAQFLLYVEGNTTRMKVTHVTLDRSQRKGADSESWKPRFTITDRHPLAK